MKIWDLHCHLSGLGGRTPDESMARLIALADRMGIERVIVFMGVPHAADPSPEDLRKQNDQVLQALSHWHHRAFGFVYVSPKHVEASLHEIDRCVRDGPMVGLKLWVAARCDSAEADALVRRAAELRAVIFQHTWIKTQGNLPGESTPTDLAALAKRHPDAAIICGHTGGQWEIGIRAVRETPNVTIDLAGSDPTAGLVEMAVRELGARRILYGSDAPGRSFASQLAKVYGADVTDEARRLILGENLQRLLTPILRAKGVKL
ncbi:MAG: amidohydrolase family protein [Isosphaeraceae bacterium]|nr:amidohydrolase family protein [Isosphaeraceae bacterium]